jgi:hypothetical protein
LQTEEHNIAVAVFKDVENSTETVEFANAKTLSGIPRFWREGGYPKGIIPTGIPEN